MKQVTGEKMEKYVKVIARDLSVDRNKYCQ